jgi:hypothetical protein
MKKHEKKGAGSIALSIRISKEERVNIKPVVLPVK